MPMTRRRLCCTAVIAGLLSALGVALPAVPAHAAPAVIAAPSIRQSHGLDCEATALQIALAARGVNASQEWVIGQVGADTRRAVRAGGGVSQWGDPYLTFVGNINAAEKDFTGYGVYAPPIARASEVAGVPAAAHNRWSPAPAYTAVQHGYPVIAWVQVGLAAAAPGTWTAWDGRQVQYVVAEHAVTLVGVDTDAGQVLIDDPHTGTTYWTPMARFEASWATLQNMAVVVGIPASVGLSPSADGKGYLIATSAGTVPAFGDATVYGDLGGQHLNGPVLGIQRTSDAKGYWLVADDGGVFSFGDAAFRGSTGAMHLNAPVVAMAATADSRGYWLVAADGGVFSFGSAAFYGSTGAMHLNAPMVAMHATPSGRGYWLIAADGGVFCFGDAAFYGSTGAMHLNAPMAGMSVAPAARGYRLVASDGGIFSFGQAPFYGSRGGNPPPSDVVQLATTPDNGGYWMLGSDGHVDVFGDAGFFGNG
jgi:uncharacterized protein YvpB